MIPDAVRDAIQRVTGSVADARPVGGGCIAHATCLETANGLFFLKWAEKEADQSFEAEVDGLCALRDAATGLDLIVPEVFATESAGSEAGYLLMEWLEPGRASQYDWRRFGSALAELHRVEQNAQFGYAVDNWIGSKPQKNGWTDSWPEFFGEKRLHAQAETVRQRGAWQSDWDGPLNRLVARLGEILPEAPPSSLLHGDLWAGNALATSDGVFALIDPAVYIGHGEVDLAMTELFGGYALEFYQGYNEAWPLEPGYPERREIYNLFHLINHLTHGRGYAAQVELILHKFGGS